MSTRRVILILLILIPAAIASTSPHLPSEDEGFVVSTAGSPIDPHRSQKVFDDRVSRGYVRSPLPTPSATGETAASVPTSRHAQAPPKVVKKPVTQSHKKPKPAPPATSVAAKGPLQEYARARVAASQWPCLKALWQRESGWRVHADNPNSDAYGIPQALPGSKMGEGWLHDGRVQIRWGIRYIEDRWGSPCEADAQQRAEGWY